MPPIDMPDPDQVNWEIEEERRQFNQRFKELALPNDREVLQVLLGAVLLFGAIIAVPVLCGLMTGGG